MPSIADNLHRVEESIAEACRQAGRPRQEVALMAVSKTHPVEYLLEAAEAGHRLFGENRVQEFAGKFPAAVTAGYTPAAENGMAIHLIGHLQANKAARAAELFSAVDTVDATRLAERLNDACARLGRTLPVLLEIKLSDEPSKQGLVPESAELAALLERLPDLAQLTPQGLMTVAPLDPDPATARTCFRTLRRLREQFARRYPRLALDQLSMGMSGDFAVAIEEGSTQVRIGTAIFGARPRPA